DLAQIEVVELRHGRSRALDAHKHRHLWLNAKVLGVLLVIECALVVIFDIAAVSKPGPEGLSLHAFNPETLTGAGLGTALCF
ncbi:hypothetical protein ACKI13_48535, partial [Streptomyces scabiei]